jgi:hypothetical protein
VRFMEGGLRPSEVRGGKSHPIKAGVLAFATKYVFKLEGLVPVSKHKSGRVQLIAGPNS